MKLLILGATGRTGEHLVSQALDAGQDVTVLVRDRRKLKASTPPLRVVDGSLDAGGTALTEAMRGQEAVISTIGRGNSFKPKALIARSVPNILAAMQASGVRRLVFTSAFGVGDAIRDLPLLPALFGRTLLRRIYADKAIGEALIRDSGIDWTIVQPAGLTNGPLTRNYRCAERMELRGMPVVSRADVAHCLLEQLTKPASIRKTLLVSN